MICSGLCLLLLIPDLLLTLRPAPDPNIRPGLVSGGHVRVADVDPELAQLGLDARRTPRRIRTPHVADQLPDRGIESWSTAPGPALPTPIGAESLAMPVHDRGWLDEDECSTPARPDAPKPDPEVSVTVPEPHASRLLTEHHQLLAQRDVLKRQIAPTPQHRHKGQHRNS